MFIHYRLIWYIISGLLVLSSVVALSVWGLKLGIDFTGGSLLEIEYSNSRPSAQDISERLSKIEIGNAALQPVGDKGYLLRFKDVDETAHQEVLSALKENVNGEVTEKRFESIGPTIGAELRKKAIFAIILVVLGILIYIAWAFRKASEPVSSWKYGLAAIAALIHDVTIPTGIFAWLGHSYGIEIDIAFVTALLTILGFSVHDTIVVFDRIRENLKRKSGAFSEIVEASIRQTVTRSINTSLTVILVLLAVFLFGGATVRYFSLALLLGVIFGTYSSIFIASPLLVEWERRGRGKR